MDPALNALVSRLMNADVFNRFRAYCPQTALGQPIVVHSKVAIVDEGFVRIGSANLNNHSAGSDTECDLAFELDGASESSNSARAVQSFRGTLISHFLGSTAEKFQQAFDLSGSVIAAIERLDGGA